MNPAEKQELDRLVGLLERVSSLPAEHVCFFGSLGRRATVLGKARSVRSEVDGRAAVDIRFAVLGRGMLRGSLRNDPWSLFEADVPWEVPGEHQVKLKTEVRPSEPLEQADSTMAMVEKLLGELRASDSIIVSAQNGTQSATLNSLVKSAVKFWDGKEPLTFITPVIEPVSSFRLQGMVSSCSAPNVYVWPASGGSKSAFTLIRGIQCFAVCAVLVLTAIAGHYVGSQRQNDVWRKTFSDFKDPKKGNLTPGDLRAKVDDLKKWQVELGPLSTQHGNAESKWEDPEDVVEQLKAYKRQLDRVRDTLSDCAPEASIDDNSDLAKVIQDLGKKMSDLQDKNVDAERELSSYKNSLDLDQKSRSQAVLLVEKANDLLTKVKALQEGQQDWESEYKVWNQENQTPKQAGDEAVPVETGQGE